jgi:hypothetical protein
MLYRTRIRHALACMFAAVPLIGVGLGGFVLSVRERAEPAGRDGWTLAFLCLIASVGMFGVLAGFDLVLRRITIDEEGFDRRSLFGTRCVRFAWTDVESWLTWPVQDSGPVRESAHLFMRSDGSINPTPAGRAVVFRLKGRAPAVFVPEQEASRPSFDRFLADIRREIGDREVRPGAPEPRRPAPVAADAIRTPAVTAIEPAPRRGG